MLHAIRKAHHPKADQSGGMGSMMQDLAFAIPGVDEAMGFAEIMKWVSFWAFPCMSSHNQAVADPPQDM